MKGTSGFMPWQLEHSVSPLPSVAHGVTGASEGTGPPFPRRSRCLLSHTGLGQPDLCQGQSVRADVRAQQRRTTYTMAKVVSNTAGHARAEDRVG